MTEQEEIHQQAVEFYKPWITKRGYDLVCQQEQGLDMWFLVLPKTSHQDSTGIRQIHPKVGQALQDWLDQGE